VAAYDLAALWEAHCRYEFERGRDVCLAVHSGQTGVLSTAVQRAAPSGGRAGAAEMETTMNLKRIAGTATIAGVLGAAALGLGAASPRLIRIGWTRTFRGGQIGFRIGIRESIGARPDRSRMHGAPGTHPVTGKVVHTGGRVAETT
jgi:hypothetical protein